MSTLTINRIGLIQGFPYTVKGEAQECGTGDGFMRCKRKLTEFLESFSTPSTRWRCTIDIIILSVLIMLGRIIRHPEQAYDILAYYESLMYGFILKHVFYAIDARSDMKRFLQELPAKLIELESAEPHLALAYRSPQGIWGSHSILVTRREKV